MRKKALVIFFSAFAFILAFWLGHHHLVYFGIKSYLKMQLPKGRSIELSYKTSHWKMDGLILHDVVLSGEEGKEGLSFRVGIEDLRVNLQIKLFPFRIVPQVLMDHPHISLSRGEWKKEEEISSGYELLDKWLFKMPLEIRQGEVIVGDQRAILTLMHAQNGKERLLEVGKKGERSALSVAVSKHQRMLQCEMRVEEMDLAWASDIGRFFFPRMECPLVVGKGALRGEGSAVYNASHGVDAIEYDFNLTDFAMHDEQETFSVGIHHLRAQKTASCLSKQTKGVGTYSCLLGDGEISGMDILLKDPSSHQIGNFSDVKGIFRLDPLNVPFIELSGNYHGESKEPTPFHFIGEGKGGQEKIVQGTFHSNPEMHIAFTWTSKGDDLSFLELDCQHLSPLELGLFKYFARSSLPALNQLEITKGSFNGSGSGWIKGKQLAQLTLSCVDASNVLIYLPSKGIQWEAQEVRGKGEIDFSTFDFCTGTCWEVAVSEGEISYEDKEVLKKINLAVAMDDQYVKSSTLECEYRGLQSKMTFEGLYTHLNVNMGVLIPFEGLAGAWNDSLHVLGYTKQSPPLMLDLEAQVNRIDHLVDVAGTVSLIHNATQGVRGREEKKCHEAKEASQFQKLSRTEDNKETSDSIAFGWSTHLKQLKEKGIQGAIHSGWFKGDHISDHMVNLFLLFLNKGFRGEGEIGIDGAFDAHGIEFTLDPTHIKYRSKEIDIDPCINEGEKAPGCTFSYDFNERLWRGILPLRGVRLKEHSFGIEFDSFSSEVIVEKGTFLFQNVDAMANGIHFQAEISVDLGLKKESELTISSYAIEGEAQNALAFLNHFDMFRGVNLPLQGKLVSGPGDMHLHAYIGETKRLLEWKVALHFTEGIYPFSSTLGFENLAGNLYYSADEKRLVVEKVEGTLMLTAWDVPRSYRLNVPLLEVDAEEGALIYDCRLEAPTHEICRLVGRGEYVEDEFVLSFNKEHTRLYGALIDVKALTFKEGRLNRAQLEAHLSALDLVHHLDFLSSSGIMSMKSATLDEMRGPGVSGDLSLKLDYDFLQEAFYFNLHSPYLALGAMKCDRLIIEGSRKGDEFNLDHFEIGALKVLARMKKENEKWAIPHLAVMWKNSFFKGCDGFFNEKVKTLTLPLEGLRVELGEVKDWFPHATFDWDFLSGTLFAMGDIVLDFSKGLQNWFLDSKIKLTGEEFSRANLRLESSETLKITYHPFSGFSIGEGSVNFLHPRSNQLWAKCQFDSIHYKKKVFGGKGVKLIVPPEMLSFLGQVHALPHLGYEEERLILFGYPIKWDNQIEALFDFSLGENKEVHGFLKEGYYWIRDKAWKLDHCFFTFEDMRLTLDLNTVFNEIPLELCANLSFADPFRSRFEIREFSKERQKQVPLVISTDWNHNEGFFIHTIEGGFCGLDFSLHHNPKNSFLDKMALAGKLRIDVPRFAKFLPETVEEMIREFEIGSGYELSGDLVLSKTSLEESQFIGYLKGKNFQLMGSVMETLLSEIRIHPSHIELNHFNLSDISGIFSMETMQLTHKDHEKWELSIPEVKITDFRPSRLKKVGKYPTRIKPLTIRDFHCENIRGTLGDIKSFTGTGGLHFINTFKRDYHILDIPFEILGRLGLDMGLLVPVRGDLDFVLTDGRIYLTQLKRSYSEGKRSQFFLSPVEQSYLDFDGNLNIHIKMKQYVLLKVTEPFTLHIGGTFEHPKYGLR